MRAIARISIQNSVPAATITTTASSDAPRVGREQQRQQSADERHAEQDLEAEHRPVLQPATCRPRRRASRAAKMSVVWLGPRRRRTPSRASSATLATANSAARIAAIVIGHGRSPGARGSSAARASSLRAWPRAMARGAWRVGAGGRVRLAARDWRFAPRATSGAARARGGLGVGGVGDRADDDDPRAPRLDDRGDVRRVEPADREPRLRQRAPPRSARSRGPRRGGPASWASRAPGPTAR